jgi:hypothetical protein
VIQLSLARGQYCRVVRRIWQAGLLTPLPLIAVFLTWQGWRTLPGARQQ